MSYYRAFFVLKEDTPGYGGTDSRAPQGRCVIEARGSSGKIKVYVQDLKPGAPYKATLIKRGDDRSIGVHLGPVEVSENRRGEARFDINPSNVNDSGIAAAEFDTIAVTHSTGRLVVVLSGSEKADGRWKSNLDIFKTQEAGIQMQEIPFIRLASYDDLPGFDSKQEPEESPQIAFKETVERLGRELTELAEITGNAESSAVPEETAEEVPAEASSDEEISAEEEVPVSAAALDSEWKEITLRELNLLPIDCFDYEQKAVVAASFYGHGNLLLRNAPDSAGKYIVGVPGILTPDEKEGFSDLGFNDFKSSDGALTEGAKGYWLKEL